MPNDSLVINTFTQKAPCTRCKRLTDLMGRECTAFPDGIPSVIQSGKNDHTSPVKGDDGFTFLDAAI